MYSGVWVANCSNVLAFDASWWCCIIFTTQRLWWSIMRRWITILWNMSPGQKKLMKIRSICLEKYLRVNPFNPEFHFIYEWCIYVPAGLKGLRSSWPNQLAHLLDKNSYCSLHIWHKLCVDQILWGKKIGESTISNNVCHLNMFG